MTDTLFSQSRTFLFGSNTTSQNRCDLKSKVGRCSGADLGFWEGFASVLDITLKHKTKVTIALRGGRYFLDEGSAAGDLQRRCSVPAPWPSQTKNGRSNADRAHSFRTPCFKTTIRRIGRIFPDLMFVWCIRDKSMSHASSLSVKLTVPAFSAQAASMRKDSYGLKSAHCVVP